MVRTFLALTVIVFCTTIIVVVSNAEVATLQCSSISRDDTTPQCLWPLPLPVAEEFFHWCCVGPNGPEAQFSKEKSSLCSYVPHYGVIEVVYTCYSRPDARCP